MKRLIIFVALTALAAFIGCQSDNSSTPTAPPSWQTELFLPDAPIVAAEGTAVTIPINALVTNQEGVPVGGVEIAFRLLSGNGNFQEEKRVSDAQGLVSNSLVTTVARGEQTLSLNASTAGGSAKGEVKLKGTGTPAKIEVMLPAMPVTVPTDAPIQLSLKAMVTDEAGSGLEGIPLSCRLGDGGYGIFGSLTGGGLTEKDGSVSLAFTSQGNFGKEYVVVATDTSLWQGPLVEGQDTLEVKRLTTSIQSLTVTANPRVFDIPPDSVGYADIRAVVKDVSNVGVPDVIVNFETDIGTLFDIEPTDGEGVARARFSTNHEVGVATITASIPRTQYVATCTIQIKQFGGFAASLRLSSDVSFIYADNGLTVAHLKARLTDGDNVALGGKQIAFSTQFGTVNASAVTDTFGVAYAVFTDLGIPSLDEHGNPVPVWVKATYRAMNLVDSVEITIRPRNPVDHITISSNKPHFQPGIADSIELTATCFLLSGDYAPPVIEIHWHMDPQNGHFSKEVDTLGQYGHSTVWYYPGQFTGQVRIWAEVRNEGGGEDSVVRSGDIIFTILPGPPSGIRLTANPSQLRTNDPAGFATITAFVTDTAGNPVIQGTLVRFTTTKGEILPTALTDTIGHAISRLTAGVESGIVEVTGSVTTPTGIITAFCTVTFIAGYPNTIELSANPTEIAVGGTGGNSTSTLTALVKDANGNPVEAASTVVFQILNNPHSPLGCDLNNHGNLDSARTANGVAVASLNAGTQIGAVLVRAYTWRDPDITNPANWGPDGQPRTDTVSAVFSRIAVVSGPAYRLDLDANAHGEDVGGGAWQVEVSARVYDQHINPVADGIPVLFTLDPDDVASIDVGATGNSGHAGLAIAHLTYNSINTFQPVTITASVQIDAGVVEGQRPWILPLQRGQISLVADPTVFSFSLPDGQRMSVADTCTIRAWATVTDGHGVLINGAPVLFSTDRGHFYWKNMRFNGRWTVFDPEPVRRLSGAHDQENNEERGVGTVYLRGWMNDFFLDDFMLEQVVHLGAEVEGYEDVVAQPATVTMIRR